MVAMSGSLSTGVQILQKQDSRFTDHITRMKHLTLHNDWFMWLDCRCITLLWFGSYWAQTRETNLELTVWRHDGGPMRHISSMEYIQMRTDWRKSIQSIDMSLYHQQPPPLSLSLSNEIDHLSEISKFLVSLKKKKGKRKKKANRKSAMK